MKSTSAIITLFFSWSEEWFFCSSDLALGKKLFRRLLVFVLSALKHFLEGVPQTFLMCEMEGICRKPGGTIHHSRLVTKWKNCRLSLSVQLLQGCFFFFVFFWLCSGGDNPDNDWRTNYSMLSMKAMFPASCLKKCMHFSWFLMIPFEGVRNDIWYFLATYKINYIYRTAFDRRSDLQKCFVVSIKNHFLMLVQIGQGLRILWRVVNMWWYLLYQHTSKFFAAHWSSLVVGKILEVS